MCLSCACWPLARSQVYQFLSLGFLYPDLPTLQHLADSLPSVQTGLQSLADRKSLARLEALMSSGWEVSRWQEEHLQAFGQTISKDCPPYHTEYGQAHIFQKAQTLADIAGFYQAFGLQLSPSFKDRVDHISAELEFMQFLTVKEAHAILAGHPEDRVALCREAQRKFLLEHLAEWVFTFAQNCTEKAGASVYRIWAELTQSFLGADMERLGLKRGQALLTVATEVTSDEEDGCLACPLADRLGGDIP